MRAAAPSAGVRPADAGLVVGRGDADPGRGTIYCFAHAGGAPAEYLRLAREALGSAPDVRVLALRTPAAGSADLAGAVVDLVDTVEFRAPFVLLGHSLGGLVAFEVARELRRRGRPAPEALVVSSAPVPHDDTVITDPTGRDDDDVLDEVARRCGSLPDALDRPELRAPALDALRRDLRLAATYRWRLEEPLGTPITAVAGRDEPAADLDGWLVHAVRVDRRRVAGGHFHLRERPEAVFAPARAALTHRHVP